MPQIRIGMVIPISGPNAAFGKAAAEGAELAVETVNSRGGVLGQKLKLITKDTASAQDLAISAVKELEEEDVALVIGEITSDVTLATAAATNAAGLPLIVPAATHPDVTKAGPGVFRICYVDPYPAWAMAELARSIQATKVAILFAAENPYSTELATSFEEDVTKHGGTIVSKQAYTTPEAGFSTQLKVIKEAQPDVIFFPGYATDAAAVIRQARELEIAVPFLGTDGWESDAFLKAGGKAIDNSYVAAHFSSGDGRAASAPFVEAFRAKFGRDPGSLSALAYDAVMLAADAIDRAGSSDHAPVANALAGTSGFPGVTGTISFDANRNASKAAVVLRVSEGKFTYLETFEPTATATPSPSPSPEPTASGNGTGG